MKVSVFRKAHFNAAHRLHNPQWSDEKNAQIFGPCNNKNYHGHNYELEVGITGPIDPVTGMVMDVAILKSLIKEEVEDPFDHKNLNLEVSEFKTLIPTVENIAKVIWEKLRARIDTNYGITVKLYETPRNFVVHQG